MATITLHQKRINDISGTYIVENTLLNEVGIPKELFALDSTTGIFNHVVNVAEITELPIVDTPDYDFYRSETINRTFTDVAGAISFAADLKRRVDLLIEEYTAEAALFPGEEDTDFPLA